MSTLRLALTPGAIVPVDVETTSALMEEVRRLHQENKELREAAQQALEALDYCIEHSAEIVAERAKDRGQGSDDLQMMMVEYLEKHRCVIAALRERLEGKK